MWTEKIIKLTEKKDVDALLKEGFYVVSFRNSGEAALQGNLKEIPLLSEEEFENFFKYDHSDSDAHFHDFNNKKLSITLIKFKEQEEKKGDK